MTRDRMQGITLTELVTVMGIMAILVSIAVMSWRQYIERTKLRTAIETLEADIRRARWTARTTSKTCAIRFYPMTNSYTINGTYYAEIPHGIRFGADPSVKSRPSDPYNPPPSDGVTFDSDNRTYIYPSGYVTPTGTIFLTDGIETVAITVAITGRPKIWRHAGGRRWAPM